MEKIWKLFISKRLVFVVFRPLTGKQQKETLCVLCGSSEAGGE